MIQSASPLFYSNRLMPGTLKRWIELDCKGDTLEKQRQSKEGGNEPSVQNHCGKLCAEATRDHEELVAGMEPEEAPMSSRLAVCQLCQLCVLQVSNPRQCSRQKSLKPAFNLHVAHVAGCAEEEVTNVVKYRINWPI